MMKEKALELLLIFFLIRSLRAQTTGSGLQAFFKEKNCDPKCTFSVSNLDSTNIGSFPKNCSTVCSDLSIRSNEGLTEEMLTSTFENMKTLIGGFTMVTTNFTSAKFLAGLEVIECYKNDMTFMVNNQLLELGLMNLTTVACPGIQLSGNVKLKFLNVPKLKNFIPSGNSTVVDMWLSPESSNFCLTTEEMKTFMSTETADVAHINAKYCEPTITEKMCKTPKQGCVEIIGDVEIKPDFDLKTMKDVEIIYGRLAIKGTNITDFGFLESLEYVARLDPKPAVTIENNKNLSSVAFPKLKRIRCDTLNSIEFNFNNRSLSTDSSYCFGVRKQLSLDDWAPRFEDFSCEILEKNAQFEASQKSTRRWDPMGIVGVIVAFVMLFK